MAGLSRLSRAADDSVVFQVIPTGEEGVSKSACHRCDGKLAHVGCGRIMYVTSEDYAGRDKYLA